MSLKNLSRRQRAKFERAAKSGNIMEMRERQHEIREEYCSIDEELKTLPGEEASKQRKRMDALADEFDALEERIRKAQRQEEMNRPMGGDLPIGSRTVNVPEGNLLTRSHSFADFVERRDGMAGDSSLSVGQYLRALAVGARSEAEERALSETDGASGAYTVPSTLAARLIDNLRAQSVAVQAGAITVPLDSADHAIAKLATDPQPAWRAELGSIAETDPTFGKVDLKAKSLAAIVRVSRELLADSINLEAQLPAVLSAAMAVEIDRAALFGSGTDPEPRGLANVSGVQEVAHGAALTDYGPMVSAQTLVRTANADTSAYVLHPRDAGTLNGLTASDGQPLQAPSAVSAVPFLNTTSVPTDGGSGSDESMIVTGQFRHLLIGIREDVGIRMLSERYADTGELAFVVHFRGDVGVEHAEAFAKITGILP